MADEFTPGGPDDDGLEGDENSYSGPNLNGSSDFVRVQLEDEMRQSYLGYAMSVIIGRALPDIRDGLKPVHRRSLYGMHQLNNRHDRPPMKSARVSGEVMGKYHPHGEQAIYNTIVIMAQDFKMRYPLVDGQGNFGSIDGDPPAASRYTEVRMSRIAGEMLSDLDKETVDMTPNYDETLEMPLVLPTRYPNLLVNGSQGIAVGMATNIPPHNLGEIIDGCVALIDDDSLEVADLMQFIKGPDFPTAGIINGRSGIVEAYKTGRGKILVRARATVETDKNGRESIIITEIPFQLNKANLVEFIANLVREERLTGISELRDESSKDGLRIVVEVKKSEMGEVILNNLYHQTFLETSFWVNSVALVDGQPKVVTLKEMLMEFIRHRRDVVIRRTIYQLREDRKRAHTLEGQSVALADIDEVVELIRKSKSRDVARKGLIDRNWLKDEGTSAVAVERKDRIASVRALLRRSDVQLARRTDLQPGYGFQLDTETYRLSMEQAEAILALQLHRLVSLEQEKLAGDFEALITNIKELQAILDSDERMNEVVKEELVEIREKYADVRKTEIRESVQDLTIVDLIKPMYVVLTISHLGYAKAQSLEVYRTQNRGGRGKIAFKSKDDDYLDHFMVVRNLSTLLCFSNKGRVFWLPAYMIPVEGRGSRGRPLVNMIAIQKDERITAIVPFPEEVDQRFVTMVTARGFTKRTKVSEFVEKRRFGKIAISLVENDELVGVEITDGSQQIMLVQSSGLAVRFDESDVRAMGRTARGVQGIRFKHPEEEVISLIVPNPGEYLLCVTENGYGKCSEIEAFRTTRRPARGVFALKQTEKTGRITGAIQVVDSDEVLLINDSGLLLRTQVKQIPKISRSTQGVRLVVLKDNAKLIRVARIQEDALAQLAGSSDPGMDEDAEDTESDSPSDDPSAETTETE